MITYTGRSVWPHWSENWSDTGPSLNDIAVGLGRQSRFAGQTREFYTVLCHTLVCGQLAVEVAADEVLPVGMLRLAALLHDAHEAVLGDTPTTWKANIVRDLERELDDRIATEFGIELTPPIADAVKKIDAACLAAEAHALGHAEAEKWWPKDSFGLLEATAFDLTVRQLQAGNPVRYLEPRNAIEALYRAVHA
jgi:5'-deoxynucleotidase YfbR-like HD superfamily hydrolase